MMEECKKENEEIKEAVEQLTQMSADEYERELYEIRERSRLTYNTEINEARKEGEKRGEKRGEERFAALSERLLRDARLEDLKRAIGDREYRGRLYREYRLR